MTHVDLPESCSQRQAPDRFLNSCYSDQSKDLMYGPIRKCPNGEGLHFLQVPSELNNWSILNRGS